MNCTEELLQQCQMLIQRAQSVCVLTGAGVSKASGIPTFRDKDGLWNSMRPEELASMDGFLRNPELVWEWYTSRKLVLTKVNPNAAHEALVRLENSNKDFVLITQNVDGLHARAGNKRILELHGNIERSFCVECHIFYNDVFFDKIKRILPKCIACGGRVRPDVVWFGEMLPQDVLDQAINAAQRCDIFLSIGTSALVYPAAELPYYVSRSDATLIEINPERTSLSGSVDYYLQGHAEVILPRLCPDR